jgi:DNA polymerase-4
VFAFVAVPDLPIQVERRRYPELRSRPLLVLGGREIVEAVSEEARALGARAGQSARQAEHYCPEAAMLAADPTAYEAAFEALLAALAKCSPSVQKPALSLSKGPKSQVQGPKSKVQGPRACPELVEGSEARLYAAEVDASGLELLFGPPPELAAELVRRVFAASGLRVRVGLGPNRLVARLAAGRAGPGGFIVVAPSEARVFLEPLPLEALDGEVGEESLERLELLGVRTLGQLLYLPRAELARQVGPDALALVQAAEEAGVTPVGQIYQPAEWLVAEADLEAPLETIEQFVQIVRPLAEGLVDQLRARHLGARLVRLRLGWEGRGDAETRRRGETRMAQLAAPTGSAGAIVEAAVRLALTGRPPGPIQGVDPRKNILTLLSSPMEMEQPPDWLELALGELGPLRGRQSGLFEGRSGLERRAQAARAVVELARRFEGRLQAPAFGRRS